MSHRRTQVTEPLYSTGITLAYMPRVLRRCNDGGYNGVWRSPLSDGFRSGGYSTHQKRSTYFMPMDWVFCFQIYRPESSGVGWVIHCFSDPQSWFPWLATSVLVRYLLQQQWEMLWRLISWWVTWGRADTFSSGRSLGERRMCFYIFWSIRLISAVFISVWATIACQLLYIVLMSKEYAHHKLQRQAWFWNITEVAKWKVSPCISFLYA